MGKRDASLRRVDELLTWFAVAVEQREIFPITDLDAEYFANLVGFSLVAALTVHAEPA